MKRLKKMNDYVAFYEVVQNGPEPGNKKQKVFESFAEIYEPSQKDMQLGNLESSTTKVTVVIRNPYPEFTPYVNQTFKVMSGVYGGLVFDIKQVAPKDDSYLKVVGGQLWE